MRIFIGVLAMSAATLALPAPVSAKTPGSEYCFHGTCHRVKTLDETRRLVGVTTTLKASFYDDPKNDRYNPSNITSSGEYFRSDRADNAASPIYPDGTKLLVWHPASRKALLIRVNNAGPYWGDRKLDLSRAAADTFGFRKAGVATVHVRVVEAPNKAEATYKKGRSYPPVKGYMGQFASLDAALQSSGSPIALASTVPAKPAALPKLGLLDTKAIPTADAGAAVARSQVASLARRARPVQPQVVIFR
jgi:rare lipoprotein A